ncbi:peptidoglycan recognition protein family protein [Nocardiopsis dassonvillei]|uniref:peptidoglycan recognition protein family protein n=1 Tax=Nocardiopsis dassonvillei TaxID=2014 RepID=UPI0036324012
MPRPDLYVSRSDLGWGPSPATRANPRSGLVIHYDSADQGLARKDHSACLKYWRDTRAFHTGPSRGWADIAYSFMSCAHGYVLEGRGLYKTQAAQPGGNTSHYSVTLATGPTDAITPEQINAVRALRQWLMEPDTSIAGTVLGHRDFVSTSCPGDKAYSLVRDGTFAEPPGAIGGGRMASMWKGLQIGSSGFEVKHLQLYIKNCGPQFFEALGPSGVDGQYGEATAEAVRLIRESIGSAALPGYGDKMTEDACEQVDRAYNRAQARIEIAKAMADLGDVGGGGGTDPQALVGATVTSTITQVES